MKYLSIILIFSFSISANAQNTVPTLPKIIDQYINSYANAKLEDSLFAVYISYDQNSSYTISDIPEQMILGGINKLQVEKQNFVIGIYKNIFCKISFTPKARFLKPINAKLIQKAKKASTYQDENGEERHLKLELINYEPSLIIKYDFANNIENKIYSDGRTESSKIRN